MLVTLSDPIIIVEGWLTAMDQLGEFKLKVRKTPQQVRSERLAMQNAGIGRKVNPFSFVSHTCISKDKASPRTAYFLPGLWPRVKQWLQKNEVEYEVVDKRNKDIRPPLDMKALEGVELRHKQDVVLAMLATLDCGIIKCGTGFGKTYCIAQLCKALPTLNIVITTSATQVVNTIYEELCKTIPGEVGILGGGKELVAGKRVIVSTLKSLPNIKPDNVHLLLVDECHACGANDAGEAIMQFKWARRFGFSASPVRNDGSGRMLEALLGPVIIDVSYEEAVQHGMVTPVKFLTIPCTDCPSIAKSPDLPDFMMKRWSYWANNSRNRAIRDIVYRIKESYDGQILIMVNSLEHAIHLNLMLPWFQVAYYGNIDKAEMQKHFSRDRYPNLDLDRYKMTTKQLDIMRAAFSKGTLRYVISTKVFKQGKPYMPLSAGMLIDKVS